VNLDRSIGAAGVCAGAQLTARFEAWGRAMRPARAPRRKFGALGPGTLSVMCTPAQVPDIRAANLSVTCTRAQTISILRCPRAAQHPATRARHGTGAGPTGSAGARVTFVRAELGTSAELRIGQRPVNLDRSIGAAGLLRWSATNCEV